MDLFEHTMAGFDRIFNVSSGQQQPRNRNSSAPVERPSPTDDAGTVGVVDLCERCHGTKLVTLYGTYMGDADDQPCPECA
jgi:hypothetical protein